ncbi:unnamed protein product [Calypogeia fissa]
MTLETRTKLT